MTLKGNEIWPCPTCGQDEPFVNANNLNEQEKQILEAAIDRMGWEEIRAFNVELHKGQSIYEDAGGFFIREIERLAYQEGKRDGIQIGREELQLEMGSQ